MPFKFIILCYNEEVRILKEYRRVRYQKSPLVEVIFQLRFPTILSINTKQPSDFQERIRERYPFYQEGNEQQNEMIIGPDGKPLQIKTSNTKNYAFISADEEYKVNLTSSFISISTLRYTQWEDFKKHIEYIVPVFEKIYKPAFYTRIGLRYVDAITREDLGLHECGWNDLIEPHILGVMTPEIENGVRSYVAEAEYVIPGNDALAKVHFELVHINNRKELSLLIDCDYFTQSVTQKQDMCAVAEMLHGNSSSFISKAITEKLHEAMEPVEI